MQRNLDTEEHVFEALYSELIGQTGADPANRQLLDWGGASASNTGLLRQRNEDRIAVAHLRTGTRSVRCAIVCDGVGGTENGHLASSAAIAAFLSYLTRADLNESMRAVTASAIRHADEVVRRLLNGSGATTLCAFLMCSDGELAAATVGDSRIYSWNRRTRGFRQVSVDDTLENELRHLNISNHAVLDAKGLRGSLSQAIGEKSRHADELRVNFLSESELDDGIVLATDGLWAGGEDAFLAIGSNAQSAFILVRRAVAYSLWSGGLDNASIVAIQDFARFCPPHPEINESRSSKISVWIGDEKCCLVLPSERSELRATPAPPDAPTINKPKRRKTKAKAKERVRDSDGQPKLLPLPDSQQEVEFSSDKEGDE